MLGYGIEPGANVFTHMHPDDAPRGLRIGAEAHEAQSGWTGEVRVRLRHADGSWRVFDLTIHNRFDDPEIDGMVGVLREVRPDPNDAGLEPELVAIPDDLWPQLDAAGFDTNDPEADRWK